MERFVVIGNPISHSLSPEIHKLFAKECGIDIDYSTLQPSEDKFDQTIKAFFQQGGRGANITVPFKENAFKLVYECSPDAISAQSVNTVHLTSDNKLRGENTDGIGLVRDIEFNKRFSIAGSSVLLIGAGGAAKGVIQRILAKSPNRLVITNRTVSKAETLADRFVAAGNISACSIQQLRSSFDLIINATSASLSNKEIDLPSQVVNDTTVTYDMVYGATETIFNQWAKKYGIVNRFDGLGMLVEQAAEAFRIWHDIAPNTISAIQHLKNRYK